MTPIEEKAQAYAEDKATAIGLPPNNKFQPMYLSEVKKALEAAYLTGANAVLSLPLSERLTEEEKEKIRDEFKAWKQFAGTKDDTMAKGAMAALVEVFSPDFFNEGGLK